jgi:hypothetical protein
MVENARRQVHDLIRACRWTEPEPGDARFQVVRNQTVALAYAFEQLVEYAELGDGVTIWTDLRELTVSQLRDHKAFHATVEELDRLLFAYLPLESHEVTTEVAVDLAICVEFSEQGLSHPLAMKLLEAYSAGYWACGWSGVHPSGKLCVAALPREELEDSARTKRLRVQQRKAREADEAAQRREGGHTNASE